MKFPMVHKLQHHLKVQPQFLKSRNAVYIRRNKIKKQNKMQFFENLTNPYFIHSRAYKIYQIFKWSQCTILGKMMCSF